MVHSGVVRPKDYYNFASDALDGWTKRQPDALALWYADTKGDGEEKITFAQLTARSSQAANFFRACGLRKGSRVLLMLPRIPAWWVSMVGLIRLGAIPVPTTSQITPRELHYRLEMAEIDAVISDESGVAKMDGFGGKRILVGGSAEGWNDFDAGTKAAAEQFEGERTRADDPGIIYFTSATTGSPKMVLHSQTSYGLAHEVTGKLWLDLKPGDVHWNISDLGWGKAAWSSFYGPWLAGACIFCLGAQGRFDPTGTLRTLSQFPITTWCAPPTALRMIIREDLARWKFPTLRHCVSAGEPLNPEVVETWRRATGLTIYEAYGQTETVALIGNFRSQGYPVRPGSMGKPAPCYQVALLDEHLRELPDGEEGEVAIRVKPERPVGLFQEYWKSPEETAAHFQGDWYLTGDHARRDTDGYYWFIGRRDDVIKSSGYRIGPFEVESALMEHEAVLETGVVGKPDPLRGQIVKAFVVLRPQFEPSSTLRASLQEHCKRIIAPHKYPREIEFVAELPKTISGKIQRKELRKRD